MWVAAFIVTCVGCLIIIFIYAMHAAPFRGKPFNPMKWESAVSCKGLSDKECVRKETSCPRGGMVRDLRRNYLIAGQTNKLEVYALLGNPNYFKQLNETACELYALGMCSGLGIDYDSLFVCYDENGVLAETGVFSTSGGWRNGPFVSQLGSNYSFILL